MGLGVSATVKRSRVQRRSWRPSRDSSKMNFRSRTRDRAMRLWGCATRSWATCGPAPAVAGSRWVRSADRVRQRGQPAPCPRAWASAGAAASAGARGQPPKARESGARGRLCTRSRRRRSGRGRRVACRPAARRVDSKRSVRPGLQHVGVNSGVLLFALVAAMVSALLFSASHASGLGAPIPARWPAVGEAPRHPVRNPRRPASWRRRLRSPWCSSWVLA